jgi:TldD protein
VAQVSCSLTGSWSVVEIVRPDGFVASDVRPLVRLNLEAKTKAQMEQKRDEVLALIRG